MSCASCLAKTGGVLAALGLLCVAAENYFYQTVDENGVLQESFFMPLGALGLLSGGVCLTAAALTYLWHTCRRLFPIQPQNTKPLLSDPAQKTTTKGHPPTPPKTKT